MAEGHSFSPFDSNDQVAMELLILGESNCGANALAETYKTGSFPESDGRIDFADFEKSFGEHIHVHIFNDSKWWDNEPAYGPVGAVERASAGAIMLCYDITSRESLYSVFQNLELEHVERSLLVLVGCKSDLELQREVSISQAKQMAGLWDCEIECIETSAKTGHNVEYVFEHVVSEVLKRRKASQGVSSPSQEVPIRNKSTKASYCNVM